MHKKVIFTISWFRRALGGSRISTGFGTILSKMPDLSTVETLDFRLKGVHVASLLCSADFLVAGRICNLSSCLPLNKLSNLIVLREEEKSRFNT